MKTWRIILAALTALCLGMIAHLNKAHAQAAPVQIPCAPLKKFLDGLAATSHEFMVLTGDLINGKRMIITMAASGSFSILETDGNMACMVAAGAKGEIDKGI